MLVQSTVKDLFLLPALPRDKWANGCVKGLKARGGVTVNICWTEGDLHEVGLWSKNQNSLRLHCGGITTAVKMSSGKVYTFNKQLKCVKTYSLLWAAFFLYSKIKSDLVKSFSFLFPFVSAEKLVRNMKFFVSFFPLVLFLSCVWWGFLSSLGNERTCFVLLVFMIICFLHNNTNSSNFRLI